jgi:hypothetical protein
MGNVQNCDSFTERVDLTLLHQHQSVQIKQRLTTWKYKYFVYRALDCYVPLTAIQFQLAFKSNVQMHI